MAGILNYGTSRSLLTFMALLLACSTNNDKQSDLQYGAIATACPEATVIGKHILTNGGNAADAAIAISFALAVAEPAMSGLGGGTQIVMCQNGGIPFAINGTTFSPKHIQHVMSKDSLHALQKSTIPSTPKVLGFLYDKYSSGQFTWAELIQPAIELCKNGFTVGPYRALVYQRHQNDLIHSAYPLDLFVDEKGHFPTSGSRILQPNLAKTLEIIANEGAESFYTGSISRQISQWMEDHNGWISAADLAEFPDPVIQPAIETGYRDHMLYSMPPPCGGWVVCHIMKELAKTKSEHLNSSEKSRLMALANALNQSHEKRKNSPISNLYDYDEQLDELLFDETGETTHFSVGDHNGMILAVTSSINAYFGCKTGDPKLGFLFNTYMDDFDFEDSTNVYAIGPSKMAYSSMSPTIIQKNGKSVLAIGSPGSSRIISSVAQCAQLFIDTQHSLDDINNQSRIHTSKDRIMIESSEHTDLLQNLIHQKGWNIYDPSTDLALPPLNAYFGGVHMIGIRDSKWEASADPRRDGTSWVN